MNWYAKYLGSPGINDQMGEGWGGGSRAGTELRDSGDDKGQRKI